MIEAVDISQFKKTDNVLNNSEWLLVVKSQDQLERRRRMLESRKGGKIGRVNERPTSIGLLASVTLQDGMCVLQDSKEFREPRHIRRHPEHGYLITEIDCVKWIDDRGRVIREYRHPFFAFLHTIDLSPNGKRMLIVSSGYDACFEIEIETGDVTWEWFAWDHGFNPDGEDFWLAANIEQYQQYLAQKKKTLLIDPAQYGEQGLVTARRTAHPNVAMYDHYGESGDILLSIAHDGRIYRVKQDGGDAVCVCDCLSQMPHGLQPYRDGWLMTNTTLGEWWHFSVDWEPIFRASLTSLGGKVEGTEEVEWVQQVVAVHDGLLLCLDANRGLIGVDMCQRAYTLYQVHPNWCIQDAMPSKRTFEHNCTVDGSRILDVLS